MSVEHQVLDTIDIVFLSGRVDAQSAPGVNEEIAKILDQGKNKMLINFKGLEYISSAGLRILIIIAKKMRASEGGLALCSLDEKIYEVFDISGFTAIFQIYDTQKEAMEALNS